MSSIVEEIIGIGQKCISAVPVTVLGSGASIPYGVGSMSSLSIHLLDKIKPKASEDKDTWRKFGAVLARDKNLELALDEVQLSLLMEQNVVDETRNLILSHDLAVFNRFIRGDIKFALTDLFKFLLRTTYNSISIVTTNYDRLAEYAAEAARIDHDTGFLRGYSRPFNATFKHHDEKVKRAVEILKVHGSVDWFIDSKGDVYAYPDSANIPGNMRPLLVTPGIGKYQVTHEEPFRSIIARSDEVFESARAIFCVGYGFNDRHIQPKLNKRASQDNMPVVILTKQLSKSAKNFLTNCNHSSFLALEENGESTRAYFHEYKDGIDVPRSQLWKLDQFLKETIGAS